MTGAAGLVTTFIAVEKLSDAGITGYVYFFSKSVIDLLEVFFAENIARDFEDNCFSGLDVYDNPASD